MDKLCKSQLLLFVLHKPCFNREYGCSTACLSNYNNCWVNFLKSLPELQATQFRQTVQLHAELLREKFKSSSSFVFNTQSIKKIFLLLKKPKKPITNGDVQLCCVKTVTVIQSVYQRLASNPTSNPTSNLIIICSGRDRTFITNHHMGFENNTTIRKSYTQYLQVHLRCLRWSFLGNRNIYTVTIHKSA